MGKKTKKCSTFERFSTKEREDTYYRFVAMIAEGNPHLCGRRIVQKAKKATREYLSSVRKVLLRDVIKNVAPTTKEE